jgi:hypothetical protein
MNMFKRMALENLVNSDGSLKKMPPHAQNDRPGQRMGLTIEQVTEYIARQKKAQGYNETISAGDNTSLRDVELPGDARVLLGFAFNFFGQEFTDHCGLSVEWFY